MFCLECVLLNAMCDLNVIKMLLNLINLHVLNVIVVVECDRYP